MAGFGAFPMVKPAQTQGRSQLMAPVIAGLMAHSPAPKTTMEGASQAASKMAGALVAGLVEKQQREKEAAASQQLRTIMSSGPGFADWQKAYDALPEDQRNADVGNILSGYQAQIALANASRKPDIRQVGNRLVNVAADGTTAQEVYAGVPELTGDAQNLRAILGRAPTLEEFQALKAGPDKFSTVTTKDAYGNEGVRVFNPRTGQFVGAGGGARPGAMPAGLGAGPARGGAVPVDLPAKSARGGGSPSGGAPAGDGMLPDTALALQARGQAQEKRQPPQASAQAYGADGSPVRIPGGVKWEKPEDGRLPDGSLGSIQWDATRNFYRILGKALKPDKGGNAEEAEAQKQRAADIVLEDIQKARTLAKDYSIIPNTGIGALGQYIPGSKAKDLDATLQTIRSNVGFDKLQQMRASSPTGGALGQVSDAENRLLQSTLGSLEQSQSEGQFLENMNRLERVYQDIVHGKGNWRMGANGVEIGKGIGSAAPAATPSAGRTLVYNPKTGRLE